MNSFNSRSLISLCLLISIISFPALSPRKASASLRLADDCLPPGKRAVAVGTDAMQFKKQPLRFEINRGQTDLQARFIARTSDSTLFLTASEAVLHLPKLAPQSEAKPAARKARRATFEEISMPVESAVIRLRPVNSNAQPRLTGMDKLPGVSNYFIGNDPRKWRTNVEAFAKVKYENLYPGIDLIYYGNDAGEIEYDFKVAVGANPSLIAMSLEGADSVELDKESGGLILHTSVGRVRQHAPIIYQEVNGTRQEIAGRYKLIDSPSTAGNSKQSVSLPAIRNQALVAFEVGDYDESKSLVIDPVVVYSTLLGGAAGNFDGARDVAVDAEGNAYIVGVAESSDFPTRNPLDGAPPQRFASKAFIAKFAPDGQLIYSTFLGSADGSSSADAIAVDATGAIYVAGTANPGFPIVNAFQPTVGGFSDAFITKLNAAGTMIIYSSFLGGNQGENVRDLKLDAQNNVYILGEIPGRGAASVTFPTVNPTQANYGGGDRDLFLSVVAATGANLLFSTFAGGNGDEEASSVSVSSDGKLIAIIFASDSTNLTTSGIAPQADNPSCRALKVAIAAYAELVLQRRILLDVIRDRLRNELGRQPTCEEVQDEFIEEVFGDGASSDIAGYPQISPPSLGDTSAQLLANIPKGQIIGSAVYPSGGSGLVSPSSVTHQGGGGGYDVIVAPIDQNGNGSARGIFGGSRDEFTSDSTKDSRGAIYITGDTNSTDLPTVAPTQAAPGGANDNGFVVVFAPDTYDVLFATYLGGDGFTLPQSIDVDPQGNIFVSGIVTIGTTFPTTGGAFQRELKGRNDAFLVKYSPVDIPMGPAFTIGFQTSTVNVSRGSKINLTLDINRTGGLNGTVTITRPETLPKGFKLPSSVSTTGDSAKFKLKLKSSADAGQYQLLFTGRDDGGRTRTATITINVQ